MAKILTAEDVYPDLGVELPERAAAWMDLMAAQRGDQGALTRPRPTGTTAKASAVAYVNHGRWVADCPFPGCHSATVVSLEDRRFFCAECRNAAAGHDYAEVVCPAGAEVVALEEVLLEREAEETRNWLPQESVADLRAENDRLG